MRTPQLIRILQTNLWMDQLMYLIMSVCLEIYDTVHEKINDNAFFDAMFIDECCNELIDDCMN